MTVTIHVAIAENGVIGREGGLPWRLSTDLQRFKADTMGKPIVMGRKTWESFPRRPLPGRMNIVVTRNETYRADGATVAASLEQALALAADHNRNTGGGDDICVIGGGEIYRQAMPLADRLDVTHVQARIEGDTVFPDIDAEIWRQTGAQDFPAGDRDTHATRHAIYVRRLPKPQNS